MYVVYTHAHFAQMFFICHGKGPVAFCHQLTVHRLQECTCRLYVVVVDVMIMVMMMMVTTMERACCILLPVNSTLAVKMR